MSSLAFARLGISDDATLDQVKAAWRVLASQHHPDHGGDPIEFDRLRKAYKEALALAEEPLICGNCGGQGRRSNPRAKGFHGDFKLMCPICKGSGKIQRGGGSA